jgi:SOS-response transcriptional repressor LexA
MARLTKSDIERKLLTGLSVSWDDVSRKRSQLLLSDPKARALFQFLLKSSVRNPVDLPDSFIKGLADTYESGDDPASTLSVSAAPAAGASTWKLFAIETEGFGGLNMWKGPVFRFEFERESLLIEGPNGSGKSSFTGAILWALAGERPRDHVDGSAHEAKPVFQSRDESRVGDWPPIACYPPTVAELSTPPRVRVRLEFLDDAGTTAIVERILESGVIRHSVDPKFDVPSVFIETGLLMPARLAVLRLSGGSSRLTDAVQMLTGMDELVAVGSLVEGLCHKSREYLSYKKKDLANAKKEFDGYIDTARKTLEDLNVAVGSFTSADTSDNASSMAKFGKQLSEKAIELTKVIECDLGAGAALDSAAGQSKVVSAIGAAQDEVSSGLSSLMAWKLLESLSNDLDEECTKRMTTAIANARVSVGESLALLKKSQEDSKFQLKAVAAQWHVQHHTGAIVNCPLCEHELKGQKSLIEELEGLRSAGSAAARTFDDNINVILASLNASVPTQQKHINKELVSWEPRKELIAEITATFVNKERYSTILVKFAEIVKASLETTPKGELKATTVSGEPVLSAIEQKIAAIERAIALVGWYKAESNAWSEWWEDATSTIGTIQASNSNEEAISATYEGLSTHLSRLSDALTAAKPYRSAAESMRAAWAAGKTVVQIEKELNRRLAIADLLEPLKLLVPLSQSVARDAIDGLSGRTAELLSSTLITERFKFQNAQLQKKEGIVVYGGFGDEIRIDATLIANTSWLRAVLWAFMFALREEAVEQFGKDLLPLLVFDDPEATFDAEHRHRWALYVASLQDGPSLVQLILTSFDQMFIELIKMGGVTGRQAVCAAAGPELGYVGLFEGDSLNRKWDETKKLNTPQAGRDYMNAARIYIEGLLRLMLRGEDAKISSLVVGDCREKITLLNNSHKGPWDRSEFKKLATYLGKQQTAIRYIEASHHASANNLGMAEAISVEEHWRTKLQPALDTCFRLARDYLILHGGLTALRAPTPIIALPEGHKAKVAQIPLQVLGRAAALTGGRIADGCVDMDVYATAAHKKIKLAQHSAYRLTAETLEPVARPGDMLLIKDAGEPSLKSLVVALSEDRALARRFEVAENHSEIAVLTAQAINPRKIAPPVIAHRSTLTMHKIVGVLYEDAAWNAPRNTDTEVCECSGEAVLSGLVADALGLVEVMGQSAEPHALNGQYLIVEKQLSGMEAIRKLDGKPVIASDTDNHRYFKRLRVGKDRVVLESMDSGGDYAPVILEMPGKGSNCLEQVWPVAGVLFELPN